MQSKRVLRTDAAAEYVALKPSTLEKMRVRGDGPRFIKLGSRAVGYLLADLDAWLDRQRKSDSDDLPADSQD